MGTYGGVLKRTPPESSHHGSDDWGFLVIFLAQDLWIHVKHPKNVALSTKNQQWTYVSNWFCTLQKNK